MEVGTLVDFSIVSIKHRAYNVPLSSQPQMKQHNHKLPTSPVVSIQSESRVEAESKAMV